MAADHHERLAAVYQQVSGDLNQSLGHIRAAREIYQALGRTLLWQATYWRELSILVDSGAFQEARAMLQDVERIEVKPGDAFNPGVAEAIAVVESDLPEGAVVEEIEAGYTMYDKVIRPARVKVSKGQS